MEVTNAFFDRLRQTTTSTGTGAIALTGPAPAGYLPFSSAFDGGAGPLYYCIESVDASGVPNGDWEIGLGFYEGGGGGFSRTTVYSSTNDNGIVDFGPGTKSVFSVLPGVVLRSFYAQAPTQVTLDFGSVPVYSRSFTFSLSNAQTTDTVLMANAPLATSGLTDEAELDGFACSARVTATNTVTAFVQAIPGPVTGQRRFNVLATAPGLTP